MCRPEVWIRPTSLRKSFCNFGRSGRGLQSVKSLSVKHEFILSSYTRPSRSKANGTTYLEIGTVPKKPEVTLVVGQLDVCKAEHLQLGTVTEGRGFDLSDWVLVQQHILDLGVAYKLGKTGDFVPSEVEFLHVKQLKADFLHAGLRHEVVL